VRTSVRSGALLTLLLSACIGNGFDPSRPMPSVDVGGFDAQAGHKNLEAIREILERQKDRPPDESRKETPLLLNKEAAEEQRIESAKQAESQWESAPMAPGPALAPHVLSPAKANALPHPSSRSRLDLGLGPVNPYQPQSLDHQPLSWHTVPPYTLFTPTGSAYPGSIRCVPDSLGGQRCRTAP
jgi:hypothetical protein